MERKYRSEILGVIHQDAKAMFEVGGISEERMREYDRDCLVEEPEERPVKQRRHSADRRLAPNGGV